MRILGKVRGVEIAVERRSCGKNWCWGRLVSEKMSLWERGTRRSSGSYGRRSWEQMTSRKVVGE